MEDLSKLPSVALFPAKDWAEVRSVFLLEGSNNKEFDTNLKSYLQELDPFQDISDSLSTSIHLYVNDTSFTEGLIESELIDTLVGIASNKCEKIINVYLAIRQWIIAISYWRDCETIHVPYIWQPVTDQEYLVIFFFIIYSV